MTQPVQEPSQGRTDQGLEFRTRQLFRRPASAPAAAGGANLPYAYLWNTSGNTILVAAGTNQVITWDTFVDVSGGVLSTTSNQTIDVPAISSPAQYFLNIEVMLDGTATVGAAVAGDLYFSIESMTANFGTVGPTASTKVQGVGTLLGGWSRLFDVVGSATSYKLRVNNRSATSGYNLKFGAMFLTIMSAAAP